MPPSRALTRSAQSLSSRASISTTKILPPCQPTQIRLTSKTTTPRIQNSIHTLLATPTWSVRSLLPSASSSPTQEITPKTLHHLLRLSALPPPATPQIESTLLATLHTQLHFVRAIQAVDTTGVAPLTAIRDENASAAGSVTLDTLRAALAAEAKFGFRGRPQRLRERGQRSAEEALVEEKTRGRREGAYFVVESGKAKGGE